MKYFRKLRFDQSLVTGSIYAGTGKGFARLKLSTTGSQFEFLLIFKSTITEFAIIVHDNFQHLEEKTKIFI